MQLIVVTGLSGSGKSIALRQLEDLGYYCIDNLPGNYLVPVAEHLHSVGRDLLAVSLDSRSDASIPEISKSFKTLKEHNVDIRVLCLTASTDALVQRYSETRRQHPLSQRSASGPETLVEAIEKERKMLEPFVGFSHIIDTTGMLPNTLNHWIRNFVRAKKGRILLTFESFGFKRGLPMASDLVFDVRCLPNPYWEEDLRKYTGKDQPVIDYLRSKPEVQEMISDIQNFVEMAPVLRSSEPTLSYGLDRLHRRSAPFRLHRRNAGSTLFETVRRRHRPPPYFGRRRIQRLENFQ